MDSLKTGDLLIFNNDSFGIRNIASKIIKWATHSNYTHIAIVLKDPHFLHPHLKGTYVWESGWEPNPDPQDGKIKLGVQITPLHEIMINYRKMNSHCYLRSVVCDPKKFSTFNLSQIHNTVYQKPYDICPMDWVEAFLQKDLQPQITSRFWCSALVGYIYTKCGILEQDTDWTIMRPSDFSLDGEKLSFQKGCSLSNVQTRIF